MRGMISKANSIAMSCCCALLLGALGGRAEVKLPSLVSDGMVLQQGMPVNIWGTADPGERVTVTLGDQQASGVAASDGQWKVKLGPLNAGGPFTMTIAGKNTLTLRDVLVGEVWVCSGQSNMEMPVGTSAEGWTGNVHNYQDEIARADFPRLRMFTVQKAVAGQPQREEKAIGPRRAPRTWGHSPPWGIFSGANFSRR